MEATIQKGVWLDFRKALIVTVNKERRYNGGYGF